MPLLTIQDPGAHSLSVRAKALVFEDAKSRAVLERLQQIAPSDATVLVLGETGTGKELTARLLHRWSGRPGAFCAVNCAAIPAALAESALFGHKKGAFSGAVQDSPGFIRAAQHGTLFLDEIAELDPALQPKLLRALQEHEVTPVGETASVPVDFRVVAATHENLDELCANDRFRPDLLARLDGHRVTLPPLRYRLEDLGLLMRALSRSTPGQAPAQVVLERGAARAQSCSRERKSHSSSSMDCCSQPAMTRPRSGQSTAGAAPMHCTSAPSSSGQGPLKRSSHTQPHCAELPSPQPGEALPNAEQ